MNNSFLTALRNGGLLSAMAKTSLGLGAPISADWWQRNESEDSEVQAEADPQRESRESILSNFRVLALTNVILRGATTPPLPQSPQFP